MKTKIYGASDELIEIEGAINEEANHYNATRVIIKVSDGTQARITYDGEWKIQIEKEGDKFLQLVVLVGDDMKHDHEDAKGCSPYSDILVLDEGIEWVKVGRKTFKV